MIKEDVVAKSLTLRTDDATFAELEALAARTNRSKNYLANEALKTYLDRGRIKAVEGPVVTSPQDLAGDFWPEIDEDDFLAFLEAERERSRAEPPREL